MAAKDLVEYVAKSLVDDPSAVTVEVVEELGADAYIYGSTTESAGQIKPIIVRVDGRTPPAKGTVVHLSPKGEHVHLFNPQSGLRIGD